MKRTPLSKRGVSMAAVLLACAAAWLGARSFQAIGEPVHSSSPRLPRGGLAGPSPTLTRSSQPKRDTGESPVALEEILKLPDSSVRHEAITSLARTDPATAAGLAIDTIENPDALQQALVEVIAPGRIDARDTLRTWIDEVPPSPLREALEAEWKRGHDLTPPPPAWLPGENLEDRIPLPLSRR